MATRIKLSLVIALFCFLSVASAEKSSTDQAQIRGAMEFLASDALQGRASGSHDELLAATYLASQNLPTDIVMAPHPELQAIPWATRPLLRLREGRAEASDMVSLQHAFAGIAETGTLMLPSAPQTPTTLNLLADTAIVLLRASRLVGAYEEAWDILRSEFGTMPRNIMLVTGPSRSADIEQTLELGAHGPRRLHVVLAEDDSQR